MAYKFQLGQAILSGALQQEGNVVVENEAGSTVGHILQSGIISGSGQLQGASVDVDGAVDGKDGFKVDGTAIVDSARAVSNVTSIDGSGDLTMGTITMTNFSVGAAGALSAASVVSRATVSGSGQLQGASVGVDGAVTAGTSFIIGSADLNEADMEKLDGITNGTAAASKAVVLDAAKDITGINNLTASYFSGDGSGITNINVSNLDAVGSDTQVQFNQNGEFGANANFTYDGSGSLSVSTNYSVDSGGTVTIGSTSIDETAYAQIGGITAGTAAASKAVVLDASLDVSGFRNVSGSGNGKFRSVYAADLTQGRLVTAGTSGLLEDQAALYYDDSREDGFLELYVSSSASGSVGIGDGIIELYNADDDVLFVASDYDASIAESGLFIGDQAAPAAVLASGDVMVFLDGDDDDRLKKESIDDIATLFAGTGLAAASAVLSLDLNELTAASVDVAADSIAIIDANDSNGTRKESIADLMSAVAGEGLKASSGALALDFSEVTTGSIAAGDSLIFVDSDGSNVTRSDTINDLATLMAGNGLGASNAVLAVQVSGALAVADDYIGIPASFAGTGLAPDVSNNWIGSLSLDLNELGALGSAGVVAADQLAFVDATDSSTKKVTMANFLSSIAGAGVSVSNGKLITEGGAVQEVKTDNLTLKEGYNYMTGSAALTLTLPASPSAGDIVHVKAGNLSGVAVTITGSGAQVMDGESSILLESPYAAVSLVYMTTNKWNLV